MYLKLIKLVLIWFEIHFKLVSNKYRIQDMFLDRHQVWRSHVVLDFLYCVEIYIFNFHNFYNT